MSAPTYAKALVAAVVSAAAPAVTAWLAAGGVTSKAGLLSALFAIVGGGVTYGVPNGKRPNLAGMVVTVKTDADEFVRSFVAGLPALVGSSLHAALTPAPPVGSTTVAHQTIVAGTASAEDIARDLSSAANAAGGVPMAPDAPTNDLPVAAPEVPTEAATVDEPAAAETFSLVPKQPGT